MQRRIPLINKMKVGSNQKVISRKDDPNKYKYRFIEEGADIYVSKKKADSFAWVLFPQDKLVNYFKIKKFTHGSEFKVLYDYKDFLKKFEKLKALLKENGMYAVYLETQGMWNLEGGHCIDYQWTDTKEYIKEHEGIDITTDYRTMIYLDDVELGWAATKVGNGKLYAGYTLRKEDKKIFYESLSQIFDKDVILPKSFSQRIIFKLKKLS